jgi:hypothetical protein
MQQDSEGEISKLVAAMDTPSAQEEEQAWIKLKPLGAAVLPYFVHQYPKMRKWQGRVSILFHSIKYARQHDEVVQLAITALSDKANMVRYRACMVLAYSLRKDTISALEAQLNHSDRE